MSMYVSDMLENRKGKGENAHKQLQGSIFSLSCCYSKVSFPMVANDQGCLVCSKNYQTSFSLCCPTLWVVSLNQFPHNDTF